jgi:hypothetical protein
VQEVFVLRWTWQWLSCSVINSVRASGSKLSGPYSTIVSCLKTACIDIGQLEHQQRLQVNQWLTVVLKELLVRRVRSAAKSSY